MSKEKGARCVNCGGRICRHEKRLEFRVGDRPVIARTMVRHESKSLEERYSVREHDVRPVIYMHLGGKCRIGK